MKDYDSSENFAADLVTFKIMIDIFSLDFQNTQVLVVVVGNTQCVPGNVLHI